MTSFPLSEFFRSANDWNRQADSWIIKVQSAWRYDDSNNTDFAQFVTDLQDQQQDYSLPTTAREIRTVSILDKEGLEQPLDVITLEQIREMGYSLTEFYKTPGLPRYYMLDGRSVLLFPKPATADVTLTEGLILYTDRDVKEFAITDTATTPGFDNHFHRIISCGAAYDYANSRQMVNAVQLMSNKLALLKGDLQDFYSTRAVENKPQIRIFRESSI